MICKLQSLALSTLCLLVVLLAAISQAQITPSQDAYTNSADPTTNYGAATLLYVDGATETTYIQFNLASIPSGASVSQATLKLYANAVTKAGSFNVDYVNGAWSESTISHALSPALGSAIVSSVPITAADKNQYILINITPAVQAWLDGSQTNDGIALVADSTFNASFDSKENTTTSHPPELDVVFAGDGTITGVTTASGSGLTGGGTSGTLNLSLTKACAKNQVLQWNGSLWGCASVGTGTVTSVAVGKGLTGGPITSSGTLSINTSVVPQLAAANTFTGNQTVNGNVSATGVVTGNSFNIGSNLFALGSYENQNAFLGFAGNTTMTGAAGGNTASGVNALAANTTGGANTANGAAALVHNTEGYSNTASGYAALEANMGGFGNTVSGYLAMGDNTNGYGNTGSGWQVLNSNTMGNYNTADGTNALFNNTTGSYNVAYGYVAGSTTNMATSTTGSNNTFVGAYTSPGTQPALTNATAIGANAEVTVSNAMVLGSINGVNGATANTYVGIGTTMPRTVLELDANLVGALGPTVTLTNNGGSAQASLDFNTYQPSTTGTYNPAARILVEDVQGYTDAILFQANKSGAPNNGLQTTMTILPSGLVGIGTTTPDDLLSVNGSADKVGGGSWGTYSDRRLKTLDGSFSSGLNQIMKINPVRYRYKEENALGIRDREEHVGLVAQDVQKVIPEAVTENNKGYLLVNNDPIIWTMLNAIKEQQELIRKQQEENRKQQAQIARLSSQVKAIRASLKTSRQTGPGVRSVKAQLSATGQ